MKLTLTTVPRGSVEGLHRHCVHLGDRDSSPALSRLIETLGFFAERLIICKLIHVMYINSILDSVKNLSSLHINS